MFLLFSLNCIITFALSMALGVFVMAKHPHRKLNRYWALVSFLAGLWSLGLWGVINAHSVPVALLWQSLADVSAILVLILNLEFVLALVGKNQEKIFLRFSAWMAALVLLALSFTSFIRLGVSPVLDFNYWISPGPLYFLLPLYYLFIGGHIILALRYKYREASGLQRGQIKYVLIAAVAVFGGGLTNFLPAFYPVYPLGNLLVVFYIAVVAYSITKQQLMDIRLVLRSSSVIAASFVSIVLPAIFIKAIVNDIFFFTLAWFDYFILIMAMITFPWVKKHYSAFANQHFFSSLYDSRQVIAQLSDKLSTTLHVKKLYALIFDSISTSMHSSSLLLLLYDDDIKKYKIEHSQGDKPITAANLAGTKRLHLSFIKQNKPIIVEELRSRAYVKYRKTIDFLLGHGVEILVPMNLKKNTIGVIALGAKKSKDFYNKEDLQVLEIIGTQSAMAIHNALQYEQVKKFGIKLEKEVARATAELREVNKELKLLDEAKSDFVSIASHQLRTPLTVIKGYISMVLQGDFGKLTDNQIMPINKVFASNERLIRLVENLLNISRIESGRLRFNYEVMDMEPLVHDVTESLSWFAKEKGVEFIYRKPGKQLPKVNIDEEKMRQVVMNLTDNSVKYTQTGKIEIELKKVGKFVQFSIKDEGMGIQKNYMPSLFRKFSRGAGISLIHTEGTGLGLYVAKQMVDAHNGKIWAESEGLGKGATFIFQIPIFTGKY